MTPTRLRIEQKNVYLQQTVPEQGPTFIVPVTAFVVSTTAQRAEMSVAAYQLPQRDLTRRPMYYSQPPNISWLKVPLGLP
jgi:hypothetical protein